ncbi:MAG: peptidoglycan bridge formation glycyltransferase FemA/FemB family protein [Treponema sp.]|nr:peptidoglycan bridge formation glycyltransferase FemA/FemB family protein [Treponema sp.]
MAAKRFLQTEFWAQFKGNHGWKPLFFAFQDDNAIVPANSAEENGITVLVRTFSIKLAKLSIAYIPMAPEKSEQENDEEYILNVKRMSALLKTFLPSSTICIRYDFPIDYPSIEEKINHIKKFTIHQSNVAIQPPDTVLLKLNESEESLLANMKSKWRYNIRLAEKKGVKVTAYNSDDKDFEQAFEHFYALFEETSKRDGVNFHAKNYYLDLMKRSNSSSNPRVTLYLAKHEEDYLAGIITLFCDREAVYLYGASGNIKRNYMPAYLLQWTAIKDAKKFGSPVYDFYGIPPTDEENHPMHGLYLFKTGFGGEIIHRPGSFDIPLRPFTYKMYASAEKIRAWFYKKAVKKLAGR